MIGTDERMRWAEALAIERLHGTDGPRWIAERIGALALEGDHAGIARFGQIASCYEQLIADDRRSDVKTRS